ncbi:hypothetical protein HN51_043716 [Arachis hypogaea]|uniref:Glycosyltransferase n=1 Tax=Arachis hypogaea TaxID=3818 RepID=A0A444Y5F6_ARAHY|nr:anthocyanidin 3-O-glucoside 2''-O-glucosyltransferase-like [Arachis ipaensis]XP_025669159.1 anthocyanidin 3-O-glucoside 2''-O-glucosyltransferase [Arachis hypogaea]QHN95778.1 Anthocyanidin 3-O-glucoside 2''-O-glucosyltransferase [Arachis hypogaea]RYQ97191.1 hypothetical protein Ahy_B08g093209 [Arachis hypogaea]
MDGASSLHIVMYPWLAMGHLTPFLHLSNKLANRGHRISFFIPKRTISKLQHLNLHPQLITFIPIIVPQCPGLPHEAETTSDVPFSSIKHIATAMDLTYNVIELLLKDLNPQIVIFDFQHWLPNIARSHGIKCVQYFVVNPATIAYLASPARMRQGRNITESDLNNPPSPDFPEASIIDLRAHELRNMVAFRKREFGSGVLFFDRLSTGADLSDAVAFKSCREIEGPYVDYLESQYKKPVILSGPLLPEQPNTALDEKWESWLSKFKSGSVIYCALGTESPMEKNQVQELLLGLELTGFPFLAVIKPPMGYDSIEEVLPEGFKERTKERSVVHGGWVPQQLILGHSSVGCFITHCGAGSVTEALVNKCQLVLLPGPYGDHVINARILGRKLRVGVEVEKGQEDGLFSKESVCKAVKTVMDDENQVGRDVRENHSKIRNLFLAPHFESSCVDGFIRQLQDVL